jgi:hypothetical protein
VIVLGFFFMSQNRRFIQQVRQMGAILGAYARALEKGEPVPDRREQLEKLYGDMLRLTTQAFILPWDKEDVLFLLDAVREACWRLDNYETGEGAGADGFSSLLGDIGAELQDMFTIGAEINIRQNVIFDRHARLRQLQREAYRRCGAEPTAGQRECLASLLRVADIVQRIGVKYG